MTPKEIRTLVDAASNMVRTSRRPKKGGMKNEEFEAQVAAMYADYLGGLSLREVGEKHGGREMSAVYSLFRHRGLERRSKPQPKTYARIAATRRATLDPLVAQMHADYMGGMSLNAVGRKYGKRYGVVRELFQTRGLFVRTVQKAPARGANGRIIPNAPLTPAELEQLIQSATRISVPPRLKIEWRTWSLERRGEFIARLRAHLNTGQDRPTTPFSDNVEPFDYSTAKAHEIANTSNSGTDSRTAHTKIKPCSQGVIWDGRLWFWSRKVGYQASGPWTPERGRPSLHQTIWEQANGCSVPAGHVIRFADGNPNNHTPANLVLITRNEVARENQAQWLTSRSRESTALLLKRSQQPTNDHALSTVLLHST